LNDWSFL